MRRAPSPAPSVRLLLVLLLGVLGVLGAAGCGDNVDLDPGKELTAFAFLRADNPGLPADATATISGFALSIEVPAGTDVTGLIATYTTTGEAVTVRGTPQDSGRTANNFTNPLVYTVLAADGTQQSYTVIVTAAASAANELTAFAFLDADNPALGADVTATITGTSIAATVPFGTDVGALVATFTTTGASVAIGGTVQASGVTANAFTTPVMYTVTAQDASTRVYTVNVTIAPSPANDLTAFAFLAASNPALAADLTATITGTAITATVPFGTDVSALVATFATTGASVVVGATAQTSGVTANDFTAPVTYTVIAADSSPQDYTVTLAFAPSPQKELTAFGFAMADNPSLPIDVTGTITGTAIAVAVPFGTDVSALVATFATTGATVAIGPTPQTSGTTANDFTAPVTYTVTAADTSTQDHVVTVTISPAATCDPVSDPSGGTVVVTNGGVFPSTATYACETGRLINPTGGETASCRFDGTWAPAPAPTCDLAIMVVRLGDGAAALTSASTVVTLEERRVTDGGLGRTLTLPIAIAGTNHPLTMSGTTQTEGFLSASADRRFVTLAGYAVAPGLASVSTSSTTTVQRVAGRVDAAGAIDTSTLLDIFSGQSVRAATTADGSGFWAVGGSGGVRFAPLGNPGTTTAVSGTIANLRAIEIFDGQLYTSTSSTAPGVHSVGTGLPTTTGQVATPLALTGAEPYGFAFADVSPVVTGVDTLYVAMAATPGADQIHLQKWRFDGATWTQDATFAPALIGTSSGVRGIAAFVVGTGVQVVATTTTTPNLLVTFHDDGSTPTPAATVLTTAATNTALRGVARSPSVP